VQYFHCFDIDLQLPRSVLVGQLFHFKAVVRPSRDIKVRKVVLELLCVEKKEVRLDVWETYERSRQTRAQKTPYLWRQGQTYEFEMSFPIPPRGAPTARSESRSFQWFVRVAVHPFWWPVPQRDEAELRVHPRGGKK